jgi:N-acetylmuramoyl-L-alanine amidase
MKLLRLSLLIVFALLGAAAVAERAAAARQYFLLLGNRSVAFDHAPLVQVDGRTYITAAVFEQLGLAAGAPPGGTAVSEAEPQGSGEQMSAVPRLKYTLAGMEVGVSPADKDFSVTVNGKPVAAAELTESMGQRYLSADQFARVGLELSYDAQAELPQLVGRIYKTEFKGDPPSLSLSCLTPLEIRALPKVDDSDRPPEDARSMAKNYGAGGSRQPSEGGVETNTFVIEGGHFKDTASVEPKSGAMTRIGFKNHDGLGRAYIYTRQPKRTGFTINSDTRSGFARISFGNFFQLASYRQTSSGEISINVQLGAPAKHSEQLMDNPPRLVLDFEGVRFEEASQTIKVGVGSVQNIRVGSPTAGNVRVVVDLAERLDYRVMSKDSGAKLYVQFLPRAAAPSRQPGKAARSGRAIMLDAGHGGSDPGAEGVVKGTNEKTNTLRISRMVQRELEAMGYTVIQTRADDRFLSLGQRGDYANTLLPYAFVSIHCNAMPGSADYQGAMTFHHLYAGAAAKRLAASVQTALIAETGAVDKGVREADFFVLRETIMPAILIECGFMTNREECTRLSDQAYQAKLARGIALGIDNFVAAER